MIIFFTEAARALLAVNFIVFGLNGFFNFLPLPKQTADMKKAMNHIQELRFILPATKIIEIFCGICLAANVYLTICLALLLPIVFGIVCLQLIFNRKHSLLVTTLTLVPYAGLVFRQLMLMIV